MEQAHFAGQADGRRRAFAWTLAFVGLLTAIRLAALFASPVELYPEEAQYWVWSRHLALGYFSKPPMIAWLIRATTAVGGQGEAWVRLSAPLVQGLAALALARAGGRLYGGWTGLWAAVLYSLAPGVQLSSGVIATDAPMLMCASAALWGYAGLLTARDRAEALRCAAALGLALGLGALAKYAALYLVPGLVLHALADGEARRRWRGPEIGLALGCLLLALGPNLGWNLAHGFETVAHTAADADWSGDSARSGGRALRRFDPRSIWTFGLAQLGVFGPVPWIVLGVGGTRLARRWGERDGRDAMLLVLAAPPLLVVAVVALVARANANWAAAAYVPASVLAAAWLVRWRARRTLALAVASQGVLGAVFVMAAVSPAFPDRAGLANSFKRSRGWAATAALVQRAAAQAGRPLSAIAVDDRFLFNSLAYYGRSYLDAPGAPPLRMWVREARPHNEAETSAPLTAVQGARALFVDVSSPSRNEAPYRQEAMADFRRSTRLGDWSIRLDPGHAREIYVFLGQGYARRPRDRRTGLPADAVAAQPR